MKCFRGYCDFSGGTSVLYIDAFKSCNTVWSDMKTPLFIYLLYIISTHTDIGTGNKHSGKY